MSVKLHIEVTDPSAEVLARLFSALDPSDLHAAREAAERTELQRKRDKAAAKKAEAVVEVAPVVEETPVVEEVAEPDPKPVRKKGRRKKAAAKTPAAPTLETVRPVIEKALGEIGGRKLRELFVEVAGPDCARLSDMDADLYPDLLEAVAKAVDSLGLS